MAKLLFIYDGADTPYVLVQRAADNFARLVSNGNFEAYVAANRANYAQDLVAVGDSSNQFELEFASTDFEGAISVYTRSGTAADGDSLLEGPYRVAYNAVADTVGESLSAIKQACVEAVEATPVTLGQVGDVPVKYPNELGPQSPNADLTLGLTDGYTAGIVDNAGNLAISGNLTPQVYLFDKVISLEHDWSIDGLVNIFIPGGTGDFLVGLFWGSINASDTSADIIGADDSTSVTARQCAAGYYVQAGNLAKSTGLINSGGTPTAVVETAAAWETNATLRLEYSATNSLLVWLSKSDLGWGQIGSHALSQLRAMYANVGTTGVDLSDLRLGLGGDTDARNVWTYRTATGHGPGYGDSSSLLTAQEARIELDDNSTKLANLDQPISDAQTLTTAEQDAIALKASNNITTHSTYAGLTNNATLARVAADKLELMVDNTDPLAPVWTAAAVRLPTGKTEVAAAGTTAKDLDATGGGGGGGTVSAETVSHKRTWYAGIEGYRAGNIVTVKSGFAGTLAAQPALNDADIDKDGTHTAVITGAATPTATDILASRDGTQLHFDVPALTTAGDYAVLVTVATVDGQTIPMDCKLRVK